MGCHTSILPTDEPKIGAKFAKFSNMTKLKFIGNDSLNKFDYMFLSKIPFKLRRHFENQRAVLAQASQHRNVF